MSTKSLWVAFSIVLITACAPAETTEAIHPTVALLELPQIVEDAVATAHPAPIEKASVPSPTPTPLTHVVQAGETLLGIAIRYGVEVNEILLVNPEVSPQFLSIGQALIIPGPGGEPISALVPSPTPVLLRISPVSCYPTSTSGLWCVASVMSDESGVDSIIGVMDLLDARGFALRSIPVHTPLRALFPDQIQPVAAYFEPPIPEFTSAHVSITGAIRVDNPQSRYVPLQAEMIRIEPNDPSIQWEVQGEIAGWEAGEINKISVLLLALDEAGGIIGFRTLEAEAEDILQGIVRFELTIYSWGPEIRDIVVYAEGRLP